MRLKSYFAPSVDEAIQRARQELGPEAMLLNSRKIAADQGQLGSYEVVFGMTGEALQRRPAVQAPVAPARTSVFTAASRAAAAAQSALTGTAPAPAAGSPVAPVLVVPPTPPTLAPQPEPVASPTAGKVSATQKKVKKQRNANPKAANAGRAAKSPSVASAKPASTAGLADELAELRKQIAAVQSSLSQGSKDARISDSLAPVSDDALYQRLIDFDFSDRIARKFLDFAAASGQGITAAGRLAQVLVDEINSRFEVAPRLGTASSDCRVVMFVGPPGAGKTTTVAKLAVKLGIQRRIPVQLLSLDTMRIGGSEQLGEYARIIGVDFRTLYSTAALDEGLDACAGKKLVLIDTPGYAPAEMDEAQENAFFLRRHPEIEVQLVLPASLRASALEKFSERFAVFQPTKLLFTHLDEVDTFGPLLEHAMKTKLPVSYLTHGQSIPQDIEEASKTRLTEGLFARLETAAASAA